MVRLGALGPLLSVPRAASRSCPFPKRAKMGGITRRDILGSVTVGISDHGPCFLLCGSERLLRFRYKVQQLRVWPCCFWEASGTGNSKAGVKGEAKWGLKSGCLLQSRPRSQVLNSIKDRQSYCASLPLFARTGGEWRPSAGGQECVCGESWLQPN